MQYSAIILLLFFIYYKYYLKPLILIELPIIEDLLVKDFVQYIDKLYKDLIDYLLFL